MGPLHSPLYCGVIGAPTVPSKLQFNRDQVSRYIRESRQNRFRPDSAVKTLAHFTRVPDSFMKSAFRRVIPGAGSSQVPAYPNSPMATGWVVFPEKCILPFWLNRHGPYSGLPYGQREQMAPGGLKSLDMALCKIWGHIREQRFAPEQALERPGRPITRIWPILVAYHTLSNIFML